MEKHNLTVTLDMITQILVNLSADDRQCLHMLALGLTWNGPQREHLRACAHGIADQLLSREVLHG